jgi:hypothetical protein
LIISNHPAGDISAALAYQIKKEIAENFFGARKALEEERDDLIAQGDRLLKAWKEDIFPILERVLYYLVDEAAGKDFLRLIQQEGWTESLKATGKNQGKASAVVLGSPCFALTAKGRFKNLIKALFRTATEKSDSLIQAFKDLQKKGDLFNEELVRFQARFNLLDILSFIKSIETLDDLKGVLGENTDYRAIPALEKAMVLSPFTLSIGKATGIRTLPPLAEIEKPLDHLIDQSFQNQRSEIKKRLRDG